MLLPLDALVAPDAAQPIDPDSPHPEAEALAARGTDLLRRAALLADVPL